MRARAAVARSTKLVILLYSRLDLHRRVAVTVACFIDARTLDLRLRVAVVSRLGCRDAPACFRASVRENKRPKCIHGVARARKMDMRGDARQKFIPPATRERGRRGGGKRGRNFVREGWSPRDALRCVLQLTVLRAGSSRSAHSRCTAKTRPCERSSHNACDWASASGRRGSASLKMRLAHAPQRISRHYTRYHTHKSWAFRRLGTD